MAMDFDHTSLDQVRAKQREFLETLESEVKKHPEALIDPVAIGQQIGLDPILTVEFIYYWVGMDRLDKEWTEIAKQLQEQLSHSPLKPPRVMVQASTRRERQLGKVYREEQRKVYAELWQDIRALIERRDIAQTPFDDCRRGAAFHEKEMQPGFEGIAKIERLAPYLEEEHYHLLRDYFNTYCNYHLFRREKYLNEKEPDSSGWTEQNAILYRRVFGSGSLEVERIFRDVLASQGEQEDLRSLFVGSVHMGDSYSAGQAGAMGPNSQASNMTFQQVWNQVQGSVDLEQLARDLAQLRAALRSEATEPEHEVAIGMVAAAEAAAKQGEGAKALDYLKKAGSWVFDMATKIGVNVVSSPIKNMLGIPERDAQPRSRAA